MLSAPLPRPDDESGTLLEDAGQLNTGSAPYRRPRMRSFFAMVARYQVDRGASPDCRGAAVGLQLPMPSSFPTIIPLRVKFPGLHADCARKLALQGDAGGQRAVKDGHLGDLAVRVEQDHKDPF